jgi:hypothetical protein
MIAVDIFADLFEWDDRRRERGHRAANAAKAFTRAGRASSGPLMYVEAVLAVLDAVDAYARYRQAREVTYQLEVEADVLRALLAELHQQQGIRAEVADLVFQREIEELRHRIERQSLEIKITEKNFSTLSEAVKKLGKAIADLSRDSPSNCIVLLKLERAYYNLVDRQLQATMTLVQE